MNNGSNEYFFGLGYGHLHEKADEIAQRHGASLVNYTEPTGFKRHWFACTNRGAPFDQEVADAVIQDLIDVGILK